MRTNVPVSLKTIVTLLTKPLMLLIICLEQAKLLIIKYCVKYIHLVLNRNVKCKFTVYLIMN